MRARNWMGVLALVGLPFASAQDLGDQTWARWEQSPIDGQPNYDAAVERMAGLVKSYPKLVTHRTIGKSVQGRPLRVLRVSASQQEGLPEMVLVGGIHGMEESEEDALFMLETLLERRHSPQVAELLRTRVLWVLPMINPDGVVTHLRKNANRVDLNRNFPTGWRPMGRRRNYYYSGTKPLCEPESQALADFLRSREHMNVYADLHRSAWLILAPPIGGQDKQVEPEVLAEARELDKAMGQMHRSTFPFRIPDQGGFTVDWVREELGRMCFTFEFEPDRLPKLPPPDQDPRYLALLHLFTKCGTYPVLERAATQED